MSYAYYKQLHPPTAVDHCLYAHFTSSTHHNLIVVKSNLLEVYQVLVRSDDDGAIDQHNQAVKKEEEEEEKEEELENFGDERRKLKFIADFELFANVRSIATVRFPGNHRDSLIIAAEEEAKISIVDFDLSRQDIRTVSLHYFEEEHLKEGRIQFTLEPTVQVDTQMRCAGMIVFDNKLIVTPFNEAGIEAFTDTGLVDDQEHKEEIPVKRHFLVDLKEMGITNIKDYCFLHGYGYHPTLLVLHEPEPTWSGRLAVKNNTCVATAVSIDLQGQQHHPVIWKVTTLPHDCYRLIPLKEAVSGGAIVVAHDSIWHLNQRATYALSLNDICKPDSDFPVEVVPAKVNIRLDTAVHVLLAKDRILFSLKKGELYLLHLISTGRSIQRMDLVKVTTSVLASCMCTIANKYLFIGSRLGDSLLVSYKEKIVVVKPAKISEEDEDDDEDEMEMEAEAPVAKRQKMDTTAVLSKEEHNLDSADNFLTALDHVGSGTDTDMETFDAEMAALYGSEAKHSEPQKETTISYDLRLSETLINIGPISCMTIGEDVEKHKKSTIQVLSASGYGRNGSVCILNRTIRPELILENDLPFKVQQMWAVHLVDEEARDNPRKGKDESNENNVDDSAEEDDNDDSDSDSESEDEEDYIRSYLVFALERNTKLLEYDDDLNEITDREGVGIFKTDTTINMGTLAKHTRGVQVCTRGIILFDANAKRLEEIDIAQLGKTIHSSQIFDPFVLIHFTDGTMLLLEYTGQVHAHSRSVFKSKRKFHHLTNSLGKITATALFSGSGNERLFVTSKKTSDSRNMFCIICWSSGAMEIYSVPAFKCVFSFLQFDTLHQIVHDTNPSKELIRNLSHTPKELFVKEIMMRSIGSVHEDPHLLVVLNDESLHVYKSFSYMDPQKKTNSSSTGKDRNRLARLRFCKVDPNMMQRRISETESIDIDVLQLRIDEEKDIFFTGGNTFRSKLVSFTDINRLRGVFLCGRNPTWIFSDRGKLRTHPMPQDAPVPAFAPFANVDNGFVYYSEKTSKFKVCQLSESPFMFYTTPWPLQKVLMKSTPHSIIHHRTTHTHLVATSTSVLSELYEDVQYPPEEGGRYPLLYEDAYTLKVYNSSWKLIDKFEFEPREQVLSMVSCMISKEELHDDDDEYIVDVNDDEDSNQPKKCELLIAVGTGFYEGEDEAGRGKIYLFDYEAEISKDGSQEVLKLTELANKEVKGSVTAMEQLNGYLICSVGPKLYVYYYDWESKQLVASSFLDTQFTTVSLNTFKNYILYGDYWRSAHFLRWRERGHKLIEMSKDGNAMLRVYRTEFMIDDGKLEMVVTDAKKNMQIFSYQPHHISSFAGKRLIPVADFHTGQNIITTVRLKMKPAAQHGLVPLSLVTGGAGDGKGSASSRRGKEEQRTRSTFALFGSLEGSIGYVAPIDEQTYRRLNLLSIKMYTQVPHAAGLHPKRFRMFEPELAIPHTHKRNVVDGQLVQWYNNLDLVTQRELARQVGTDPERVFMNIAHLNEATFYY